MAELGTIQISLTQDEADAIVSGINGLVTSSGSVNLLASVRAKIEDALTTPDHPPPLNHDLHAKSITSQGETS